MPALGRHPADRVDPGVGHLHVEDRVLVGLAGDQVEVDGLGGVDRLQQVGEAGGVGADLVEQVVERDEVAGALRDRDRARRPARARLTSWVIDDLQLVGVVAERLHGGLHPRHVAVVVGAPDVDEQVEAAGELVAVVGDVGQQVGVLAVALDQHPVLVVAEVGGAQPDRAVRRRRPRRARAGRPASARWHRCRPSTARRTRRRSVTFMRGRASRAGPGERARLAPLRAGRRPRASRRPSR